MPYLLHINNKSNEPFIKFKILLNAMIYNRTIINFYKLKGRVVSACHHVYLHVTR